MFDYLLSDSYRNERKIMQLPLSLDISVLQECQTLSSPTICISSAPLCVTGCQGVCTGFLKVLCLCSDPYLASSNARGTGDGHDTPVVAAAVGGASPGDEASFGSCNQNSAHVLEGPTLSPCPIFLQGKPWTCLDTYACGYPLHPVSVPQLTVPRSLLSHITL